MEQAMFTRLALFVFAVLMLIALLKFCSEVGVMLKEDREAHMNMDQKMQEGLRNALGRHVIVVVSNNKQEASK